MRIIIRNETPADYRAVENLTRESFWNVYRPGCTEHYILHVLRDDPAFVPELDFVMEKDGELIGHVMLLPFRDNDLRRQGHTHNDLPAPSASPPGTSGRATASGFWTTQWKMHAIWVQRRWPSQAT